MVRISHKQKRKITAFKAQSGLKLAKHGWRFGETGSRHCKGRERGVGEEGKGREANEAERGERDLPFAQNKRERERDRERENKAAATPEKLVYSTLAACTSLEIHV
jgi:hypothetical protein